MGLHHRIVASAFRVLGLLFGIPSIVTLAGLIYAAIDLRSKKPPDGSGYLDVQIYGVVGLLYNVLGEFFELLSEAAMWVIVIMMITSLLTTLFAALLYFTGRGIGQRALWARIVAMLLTTGFLLTSIGVAIILGRDLAPLAGLPIGLSLYTIWVLGWRWYRG